MSQEVIAFVPARGGSKRTPDKHTRPIAGKNLIQHTFDFVQSCEVFSQIHFSSDADNLIEIAKPHPKTKIFKRDPSLAGDDAPLIRVIQEHVQQNNLADDTILCLILTTNILRTPQDFTTGLKTFKSNDEKHGVLSVGENEKPPELFFKKNSEGALENYFGTKLTFTKKQSFKESFYYNDAFIIDSVGNWKKPDRLLFYDGMLPAVMPALRSVYIDHEFQLELSELIYKSR